MGTLGGILLVVLSFAHIIYGEKKQIPDLKALTSEPIMVGSLRVMIIQGGILLLAVGIVQILVSVGAVELLGVARYIPVGIVLLNFCTFLVIAIFIHKELLKITIPQLVIFIIIIVLLLLSI
ncbi:MAG: hypothetical protein R3E39_18095 [Anaerolineae bacterium]